MKKKIEKMFSQQTLTLYWRGRFGTLTNYWFPDTLKDRELLRQFMNEAKIHNGAAKVTTDQLDKVMEAAGNHGYSLTTVGEP